MLFLPILGCGRRSTDDWIGQLRTGDVVHRRQAIRELAASPRDFARVVPALTDALQDKNAYIRHDAAAALGKFGNQARPALGALTTATNDPEPKVRLAATEAIKKIDPNRE